MNKQQLLGMLTRCQRVIEAEAAFLRAWEAGDGARAAACRAAIARIREGPWSPAARLQNMLRMAESLPEPEVRRPPATDHELNVAECERSAAFRASLDSANLPAPTVELAIAIAPDNAEMSAMNAVSIFNHCTRRP